MTTCATDVPRLSQPEPRAVSRWHVQPLTNEVVGWLHGHAEYKMAVLQWIDILKAKFTEGSVMVEVVADPDTNEYEVNIVFTTLETGKDARLMLDAIIDEGLPVEAERHLNAVTVVILSSKRAA